MSPANPIKLNVAKPMQLNFPGQVKTPRTPIHLAGGKAIPGNFQAQGKSPGTPINLALGKAIPGSFQNQILSPTNPNAIGVKDTTPSGSSMTTTGGPFAGLLAAARWSDGFRNLGKPVKVTKPRKEKNQGSKKDKSSTPKTF